MSAIHMHGQCLCYYHDNSHVQNGHLFLIVAHSNDNESCRDVTYRAEMSTQWHLSPKLPLSVPDSSSYVLILARMDSTLSSASCSSGSYDAHSLRRFCSKSLYRGSLCIGVSSSVMTSSLRCFDSKQEI